jgi:hypothetical protein
MITNFATKLADFCVLLEKELNEECERVHGSVLNEMGRKLGQPGYHMIGADVQGTRFARVWDRPGGSQCVKYFVEKDTGIIYGAKTYKAHNPIRKYGTLDTIHDWFWGTGYATNKDGQSTLVPKSHRVAK